jgi:hypothetical protein
MFRTANILLLLALSAGLVVGDDDDGSKRPERRLLRLENRAKKMSRLPEPADAGGFFVNESQRLVEQARARTGSPYEFDRILEALDDLLDAREDVAAGQGSRPSRKEGDGARDTARRLERAYFRVQQAEYFARLSADKNGPEYVRRSRQLYQKARAAYDAQNFYRANKLASASTELINVLENLAQAAVRKPDPPVLE